ncbi:MAG TPA: endonuclease/exonuclease/phosphatase family protein [Chthoniobacterales bacterium]|nr:endonuclease/exonuclease/phosphatase family protein [Chthoniobacterales bacterium]
MFKLILQPRASIRSIGRISTLLVCCFLLLASLRAETEVSKTTSEQSKPVIVASYNVDNYLTMPRHVNGRYRNNAGKPESEKTAVAKVVAIIHPDIIAFMEMGDIRQFHDLQRRLRERGLDYPYSEYLQGWDTQRHVALLSRFPLLEHHSQGIIPLTVHGKALHSPRGILDVTVELQSGYQLRILALHLKAKVNIEEYNQAELREAEAHSLHRYIHDILTANPKTHLLVMGDFNDTKNSKPIQEISGKPDQADSLHSLPLTDDRKELWTEYWKTPDEYSRIDYMMVNKELEKAIQLDHSGIARPDFWNEASDHCALFTTIIPEAKKKEEN